MSPFLNAMVMNALEASILALFIVLLARRVSLAPPARHLLWLLVVLKLLLPPLWVHPLSLSAACTRGVEGLAAYLHAGSDRSADLDPLPETEEVFLDAAPVDLMMPGAESAETAGPLFSAPEVESDQGPRASTRDWKAWLAAALFLAWLAGALVLAFRQVTRTVALHARLGAAEHAPREVEAACGEVAALLGLSRRPPVRLLEGRFPPLVWTLGRPTIVFSREVLEASTPLALRNILAHEMAHLRRRDHWTAWIELLAVPAYWWLPTCWWARRELHRAADEACDAWAVSALGSRQGYAASLLSTLELLSAREPPLPVLGRGLGEREAIQRRLIMIMRDPLRHRLSLGAVVGVVLAALLVLPAAPERLGAQSADGLPPVQAPPPPSPAAPATPQAPDAKPAPPAQPAQPGLPAPQAAPAPPRAVDPALPGDTVEPPPVHVAPVPAGRSSARFHRPAPPVALPATPFDVPRERNAESRLSDLEGKMERILKELEALRAASAGWPAMPAGAGGVAPRAKAPMVVVRRTVRAAASAVTGAPDPSEAETAPYVGAVEPAPRVESRGRAAMAGQAGLMPGRPGRVGAESTLERVVGERSLTREERKKLERIDREFQDRIEALRREHEEVIRKALREIDSGNDALRIEIPEHKETKGPTR